MEQLKQRNMQRLKIRNKQLSNKSRSIHTHKKQHQCLDINAVFFVYKPAISLPTAGYYPITAKQKQHYHATVTGV